MKGELWEVRPSSQHMIEQPNLLVPRSCHSDRVHQNHYPVLACPNVVNGGTSFALRSGGEGTCATSGVTLY